MGKTGGSIASQYERYTGFDRHAEVAIEDTLVGILMYEPEMLKREAFAKIRVPLAEFDSIDKEERMRFLLAELGRNQGRRNGVETFECLLRHFDLSGAVDDGIKKMLWQTHHLRNVIVHRDSRADRRLVDACPWLELAINEKVTISDKVFRDCASAVCRYVTIIVHRLGSSYGVEM